jgi:hypothetical protein
LAVRAFRELLDMHLAGAKNGSAGARCTLVLAGGYDARLAENRDHFAEIQALVRELGLQDQARRISANAILSCRLSDGLQQHMRKRHCLAC